MSIFEEAHRCNGIWGWTLSVPTHNYCHIGFCETLLIPYRCRIGHSQENTTFLAMDENGCGDAYRWRNTHFLWKTPRVV